MKNLMYGILMMLVIGDCGLQGIRPDDVDRELLNEAESAACWMDDFMLATFRASQKRVVPEDTGDADLVKKSNKMQNPVIQVDRGIASPRDLEVPLLYIQ